MTETNEPRLQRVLGPTGVTLLTLSVLSPGASVLVAGGDILHQAGTGAAIAFLLGGILTLTFTFAQAELGSSFPLAGGDYATIGNTLGPRAGFAQFGVNVLQSPVFMGISAIGVGLYVHVLVPGAPVLAVAIAASAIATGIALLNIHTGAILTGIFLAVEMAALAIIAVLGLGHPARSFISVFAEPIAATASGPVHVTWTALGLAIAAGSWATSGAGQAIYFSEEMHTPASVGRLVIAIVLMTVLFEFLPVLGIVAGTGNLNAVLTSDAPFIAFLAERASPLISKVVTLGIVAALFNALVAGVTCYGRFVYSSGRDKIWSDRVNRALVKIHPRFGSPYIATIVFAVCGVGCCFFGLSSLVILAAGCGIAQWVLINVAGIAGRRQGLTGGLGTYRAPLFPLTHILSLAGAAVLAMLAWSDPETGRPGVMIVVATIAISLLYHRYVLDRRGSRWTMIGAVDPTSL